MTAHTSTKLHADPQSKVQAYARAMRVTDGPPNELAIYRGLSLLPDWLDKAKAYCADPPPAHNRAADWLLDNSYQVVRAIRRLDSDLPRPFYRRLPVGHDPSGRSAPRVFLIATDIATRSNERMSAQTLVSYLNDYQTVSALSHAELWALPSMLRLASLEMLMQAFARLTPKLHAPVPLDLDPLHADPTDAIAHAITNLMAVEGIKWADLVDLTSRVEATLATDPAGIYAQMTFQSRDRYRKTVEHLADRSALSEVEVAAVAVQLANDAAPGERGHHVGFWLIDNGRDALETAIGCRQTFLDAVRGSAARHAAHLYATALIAMALAAFIVPIAYLSAMDASAAQWVGGIVLSLLPATMLSVTLVHWLITVLVTPQALPELDFSTGIPDAIATAVIVPVIIKDSNEIAQIIEKLEIRRHSNPDPALHFVVLSDFADADAQHTPDDHKITQCLAAEIGALNTRYGDADGGPFYVMHRDRLYNPHEGCWMGRERKRGKLEAFNTFVLHDDATEFTLCKGQISALRNCVFAIVLDADTNLPPGTAARLVGTMAHPLNRAAFDPATDRVSSGYTIMQPRIEIILAAIGGTEFAHLHAGDTAIDIYSRAVSDVYQDTFGTGIFVGKGIYDIAAMQRSLDDRVPENSILSHDLFEGILGRAALVSNIVLYEDFPQTYPQYATRLHRWVRGDWQLLPWLGRRVPSASGLHLPNRLSGLDRWKIVDNLRRSLISPALLLLFVAGWAVLPGSALVWTLLALAAPASYLIGAVYGLLTGRLHRDLPGDAIHQMSERGGRWFLLIAFLVSDAMISVTAAMTTLWRVYVSRKNLLEWTTADHHAALVGNQTVRATAWRLMWPSSDLAVTIGGYLALYDYMALWPAAPILLLWSIAPEIAVWTARPRVLRRETLTDGQRLFLRWTARRTWHFFETFTGPKDNWLPPDNFQETPNPVIAHRTSPTNIGMFLVSALSARDLGFIGTNDLLVRTRNTVDTLDRLKTHRGHVLNWYDTRTLAPLEPQYVSTVDSGNLAMALIALAQGCDEAAQQPAIPPACRAGLRTTLELLVDAMQFLPKAATVEFDRCAQRAFKRIDDMSRAPQDRSVAVINPGDALWADLDAAVLAALGQQQYPPPQALHDIQVWLGALHQQLHAMARDIGHYHPYLDLLDQAPPRLHPLRDQLNEALKPDMGMPDLSGQIALAAHNINVTLSDRHTDDTDVAWLGALQQALSDAAARQNVLQDELHDLADRARTLAYGMDFKFLYDPAVRLFVIGFNLSVGQLDHNHYDLLATEARIASFFAIAKHDVLIEHWFSLGRPITRIQGKPAVLSWNGSMFEYLMPSLFLPTRRDTLLGDSEMTAVAYQRGYATERGVPWGVSESAYGATDAQGNYQYRAFGVPGLGIRRGLTDDLVIAPYATALALCAWPRTAARNLAELEALGASSSYGFIDAIDYTARRLSGAADFVKVRTYMAHHQGMTMAAIANVLLDDIHVRRTMREKSLRAVDLLLQERVPWEAPVEVGRIDETWEPHDQHKTAPIPAPWVPSPHAQIPLMHILGNGNLSTRVSEAGAGGLFWRGDAMTRWQPSPTQDQHGIWIYITEPGTPDLWSVGRMPTGQSGQDSKTVFHHHMIETFRRDHQIATRMELTIAPSDDVEIREITVTNESDRIRTIDFTSYAEVVLSAPNDDERHPAFSKLFVGSTFIAAQHALLFQRRPQRPETKPPVLLHQALFDDPAITLRSYDTDRAHFIGRNGSLRAPHGIRHGLQQTTGWVLDPIMALQVQVCLQPLETKRFAFLTVAGPSRGAVLDCATRFSIGSVARVVREASLATARNLSILDIAPENLPQMQVLSSLLLEPTGRLRKVPDGIAPDWAGQPELWRFGISGDLPILLIEMADIDNMALLDILVRAQSLWRHRGLSVDLVVLHTSMTGYDAPLRDQVMSLLREAKTEQFLGQRGGIHLVGADQMQPQVRRAFVAAAYVAFDQHVHDLSKRLDDILAHTTTVPVFEPTQTISFAAAQPLPRPAALDFDNEFGGFDRDTGDYVIQLDPGRSTPAPWCNILANEAFGTMVSESGLGFSWADNCGENRLTPWSNDPVTNAPGEVMYLRDEATAQFWTTTPAPLGRAVTCQIRHGTGYTVWRQNSQQLEQELRVTVPPDAPVKLIRLRMTDVSGQNRRITATYYVEWLLGAMASVSKPHVRCVYDPTTKAIMARNGWNPEFGTKTAFLTASLDPHSITGDKLAFLGKEGTVDAPDAMQRWDLGGSFSPGSEACGAYQVHLDIAAGQTKEVVFILGQADNPEMAAALITRWRNPDATKAALTDVGTFWESRLNAVQVQTPDPALDLMVNRWLPYQNIACRLLARGAFYQAGGAYGFRDQLQDVLAVLFTDPARARDQILRAARHQFDAGDALHWWHPPLGRGVRTRCSDDYLWLAYVTARYVETTGDTGILTQEVPFLSGPPLGPDEHDRYAQFDPGETGTLYAHCAGAMDRMIRTGQHGLPLMGTGDWNDGMDRIGDDGKGESVWLAWFQIATTRLFAPLAELWPDQASRAARWQTHCEKLRIAIDQTAWDGAWYMRAFDDGGEPWGSHRNDECQIDLIAQAWRILSGDPPDDRARTAMQSAATRLIDRENRLIRLLDPPFHHTLRDPGYIRAYPPGIRENGGQYTHAATWIGLAFAALGDGDRAWQVFDTINPIRRTATVGDAAHYLREPYVLPGDVSGGSMIGVGGWSWYTGAAGWTWQLAIHGILGLRFIADNVIVKPCMPTDWGGATVHLRSPQGDLTIIIEDPDHLGHADVELRIDGAPSDPTSLRFPGQGKSTRAVVRLVAQGTAQPTARSTAAPN